MHSELKNILTFVNQYFWKFESNVYAFSILNAFLFIYRNDMEHIFMHFNLKIILAFSMCIVNTTQFRIVNRKYSFFNSVKLKNNISNFCATWILLTSIFWLWNVVFQSIRCTKKFWALDLIQPKQQFKFYISSRLFVVLKR